MSGRKELFFALSIFICYVAGQGCGISYAHQGRIIGGDKVVKGAWPWQVLLTYNSQEVKSHEVFCGGSLIHPEWVITAAHCLRNRNKEGIDVIAGDHDLDVDERSEQIRAVSRVISHPAFNMRRLASDIALIKVVRPFLLNSHVAPVCLANQKAAVGAKCFMTGWGKTSTPGHTAKILQQAKMFVVDRTTCERKNRPHTRRPITSTMICAGDGGIKSGCHGDSGGPLVCRNQANTWLLYGVTSFGSAECRADNTFTVFTSVHSHLQWIHDNMKGR